LKTLKVLTILLLALGALQADVLCPARNPAEAPSLFGPAAPVAPSFSTGVVQPGSHPRPPADDILLQESFDGTAFPPAGWTRIITDTSHTGTNPAHWDTFGVGSTMAPRTPPRCAGMWWSWNLQQEWLITPPISLTGGTSYQVEWWTYGYRGSPNGDHYYTKISTDDGSTWTVLLDLSWLTTPPDTGWNYWATPYQIDLTSYAGQRVKLAWHADDGTGGPGVWFCWGVDDITVTSAGGGHPTNWVFHSHMPEGYMDNAAVSVPGYVYVASGYNSNADSGRTVARCDVSTHTWDALTTLPMPVCNGGAGIIGDTLYVCGGYTYRVPTTVDTLLKYSFTGNNWNGSPGPFAGTTYNWSPTVLVNAGKLYYISGCNAPGATSPTTQCWAYTPGAGWAAIASMNQGRVFAMGFSYHDTVWIAGGNANSVELNHTEFYDPVGNTWTVNPAVFPTLPKPLWAAAAGIGLGKFYVAAGASSSAFSPMSYFYDPSTHTWSDSTPVFTLVYRGAGCGNSQGEPMALGGDQGTFTPLDTVQYVPSTAIGEARRAGAFDLRLSVSPNPAFRTARVQFNLPVAGRVDAGIYDLSGKLVRTLTGAMLAPGAHEFPWNRTDNHGRSVQNGTYICRVMMNGASVSVKAVVLN
jgi:hypothetical protein